MARSCRRPEIAHVRARIKPLNRRRDECLQRAKGELHGERSRRDRRGGPSEEGLCRAQRHLADLEKVIAAIVVERGGTERIVLLVAMLWGLGERLFQVIW